MSLFRCKRPVDICTQCDLMLLLLFLFLLLLMCVSLMNDVQVEHGALEKTEEIRESEAESQSKLVKQISE